jgi:hypothetical protein
MKWLFSVMLFLSFSVVVASSCASAPKDISANRRSADKIHEDNLKKYEGKSDYLVLPGMVADKKTKRVTVVAETTTIEPGAIAEFILISEKSGHDYEAFAVAFALPSDIVKGMQFIGMEPGVPINENASRFWPKGERVIPACRVLDGKSGENEGGEAIRLERLVKNSKTDKTMPETGLVFVGSQLVDSREKPGQKVLAADEAEPNAIATTYNDPTTVFDVPREAAQKSVYGQMLMNGAIKIATNTLISVTFEPEYKDGRKRVCDLILSLSPKADGAGQKIEDIEFKLTANDGKPMGKGASLNSALEVFSSLNEKGQDPFVTFKPSGKLTLKAIHDCYSLLSQVESEKGIRIEPPPEGSLYYRAFLPPDIFRDRTARGGHPWELRLSLKDSKTQGVLTSIEEIYPEGKVDVELKPHDFPVESPEALAAEVAKHDVKFNVILVFVPPEMTHDQLMAFVTPAMKTHPRIHVFLQTPDSTDKPSKEQK